MFVVIGTSEDQSSRRVACAGAAEAMAEIAAQKADGKSSIQVFGPEGDRVTIEQLAEMVAELDTQPVGGDEVAALESALLQETAWGSDADVDVHYEDLSIVDLTQLAAALRPGACLTIRGSERLQPMERERISSARPGQVRFL